MINCETARPSISALHDGEPIAHETAEHIARCKECRQRARDYADIRAELRLLAARTALSPLELPELSVQTERAVSRSWRWPALLIGHVPFPRPLAAVAALVIIVLSISLALVLHAQVEGPWVQFSVILDFTQAGGSRGMTGIIQSPAMARGTWVWRGSSVAVALSLRTVKIRDGVAHIEVAVRGLSTLVDDRTARELVNSMQPTNYWYIPGETIQIPIDGVGSVSLTGSITETQPVLAIWDERPLSENELRLDRPVLLRGKEVILEGAGSTVAVTVGGGQGILEYYIPGEGRFQIALEPFRYAVEGVADGSMMRFRETGIEYRIFSRQAITGGDQPHRIWIRHDAAYRPSAHGGDDSEPSLSAERSKSSER